MNFFGDKIQENSKYPICPNCETILIQKWLLSKGNVVCQCYDCKSWFITKGNKILKAGGDINGIKETGLHNR